MKVRFIINPIAGTGKQKGIEESIEDNLNYNYDIFYTKKAGDAKLLSKKAILDNIDIVIAVGGDGTVNECAQSLINSNTTLGFIPCGSGNGFALHFGMSKNIKKAIRQINNCKIKKIDSGNVNGLTFVNVSGIGFDAHIAKQFNKLKKRGLANYINLIYKELKYKAKYYSISYDGNTEQIKAILISFANTSQYGNNFQISPNAKTDDGLIDFVILKDFARWKVPYFIYKVAIGEAHLSKYIRIIRTTKMIITSKEKLIHLDGEAKNVCTKLEIKAIKKSLKILIPNEKK